MRTVQITLFLIANVVFISQAGRDVHQLIFGAEPSVLDQFEVEVEKVRATPGLAALVRDYRSVTEQTRELEKGKKEAELGELHSQNEALYARKDALRSEIQQREVKSRELRDTWLFGAFGLSLILLGAAVYGRGAIWPGFSILIAGFGILEYWASPSYSGGGAASEFHQLLVAKVVLTFIALGTLYLLWPRREAPRT